MLDDVVLEHEEKTQDKELINLVTQTLKSKYVHGVTPLTLGRCNAVKSYDSNELTGVLTYRVKDGRAIVYDVVVKEDYKRKGIGRELMHYFTTEILEPEGVKRIKSRGLSDEGYAFAKSLNARVKNENEVIIEDFHSLDLS